MDNSLKRSYSEVDKILSLMEFKYVDKVPKKLRETFKNEKIKGYDPKIDINVPLYEQNLEFKTYVILAMLHLNCWCETKQEKQDLFNVYLNNDKKTEQEIVEKYGLESLFNNNEIIEKNEELEEGVANTQLAEYKKEKIVTKLLNRIIGFLKKIMERNYGRTRNRAN